MFGRKGVGGGKRGAGGVFNSTRARADEAAPGTPAASAAGSPAATPDLSATEANRLVVGPGLTFTGAIARCDHLSIGGRVASEVDQCRVMEIAPGGSFEGRATVTDADIAGQYEGELNVLGCLRIRATGQVKGRIVYGQLAVEPGGRLLGVIDSIAEAQHRTRPVVVPLGSRKSPAPVPVTATTHHDGKA